MSRHTKFFSPASRVQNFSNKPKEPLVYKLYQYKSAQHAIENYTEAVALFGTRRLGKTVTLNQLWDKYHTSNSLYLKILPNAAISDVLAYINNKVIDNLFIDEITNILALDTNAADLLDYCKAFNIKLITTGTNSFLLAVALNNSACGRFNLISFNPPNIRDLINIKGTTLIEFMFGQNTLYLGKNYLEDISYDIIRSIDHLGDYHNEPMYPISSVELIKNIEIIVELIIFHKDSKLPRNELIFSRKFYRNLDFDEVIYRSQSKKEMGLSH